MLGARLSQLGCSQEIIMDSRAHGGHRILQALHIDRCSGPVQRPGPLGLPEGLTVAHVLSIFEVPAAPCEGWTSRRLGVPGLLYKSFP